MSEFYNDQWRLPNNENKDKQSNYSMDFDTANTNGINCGTVPTMFIGDSSVSIWFKSEVTNSKNVIFGRHQAGSGNTLNRYVLRTELSGSGVKIKLELGTSGGDFYSQNVYSKSVWHHLVCTLTYSGGQYTVKFYVDGVEDSPTNSPMTKSAMTSNNTMPLILGGMWNWNSTITEGFIGLLDAVSIFNYALSSSQITTLYGSISTGIGNPMSLSPKPVAYYPLGDQDAFNGAEYLVPNSSLKDYVFDFDGSNDYIDLGNLQPSTTSLSISAWAYKTDATNASIIGRGASVDYGVFIYNSSLMFGLNSGSWSTISMSNFTNNYLNQWFHVCATWNGSTMKLYLNGNEEASASKTGTITYTSNDTTIGKNSTLSGFEWDGKISNVQTFNTALPATGSNSVETLYNNGSPLTSMTGFTSLQGWWKLDASDTYDGTNWTIEDHAGSNDGTSSGMTQANLVQSDLSFTSGYSPYALDFDGVNDYIDCGSVTSLNNLSAFSTSTWINYEGTISGSSSHMFLSGGSASNNRFYVQLYSSNQIRYGYNGSTIITTSNMSIGNWYNIVTVHNGTSLDVYLNGVKQNASTVTVVAPSTNIGNNFQIGKYFSLSSYYFNGSISNASIWNTALTSTQVTEIYSEGIPQNLNNHSAYSNLVSWWQLGSNSSFNTNWTVLDEITASGNNGVSANMTEADIVDGVGSYANGLSSGMGGDEVIGDAPYSSSNSLSVNMDVLDRVEDTPS